MSILVEAGPPLPEWAAVVAAILGGLVLLWLALVGVLWVQQRRAGSGVDWRGMMQLVPDVVRLLKGVITDPAVPRATRWALVALLAYLLLPIDLIPDFIPVLGFADDAIVAALVLRFAIRHSGMDAIERHWTGTADGLASVVALAGLGRPDHGSGGPPR